MNPQAVLTSARFGDDDEIRELLAEAATPEKQDALVNFVQDDTKNTPLHMACANGHAGCVKVLIAYGARHMPNANGNYPLHWAVQNRHLACVKLLLEGIADIDVLAQNGFGRGSVTEAFQSDDPEILSALLEHTSATEERLVAGSMMDNASIREEEVDEDDESKEGDDGSSSKIIQETVLQFGFDESLPVLKARELALDWTKDAFGTTAEEDITGVSIWSASLILSRWIVDHASEFDGKQVCELGSGCGVSGIASFLYTKASRVVLSDLFDHTLRNLEHNVELNKTATAKSSSEPEGEHDNDDEEKKASGCSQCGIAQRFTADNPEGKLMKCGGCRVAEYCSRECQKKAWKKHKVECKEIRAQRELEASRKRSLEVAAIDWAKPETWPQSSENSNKFDVLIGSDLVYHQEIVSVLVNVVDGLVKQDGGKFIHVASQARHSLVEFKDAMEARGFSCEIQVVPDSYKSNPLVGDDAAAELFHLHFNEMSDIYCTYIFERRQQ